MQETLENLNIAVIVLLRLRIQVNVGTDAQTSQHFIVSQTYLKETTQNQSLLVSTTIHIRKVYDVFNSILNMYLINLMIILNVFSATLTL